MCRQSLCFNCEKVWLAGYVKDFLQADKPLYNENIILKRIHSFLVADHMLALARDMDKNLHDSTLAGIIGLFHDIGRFKQYRDYNTFSDQDSVYHGDLGIRVLEEAGKLSEFDTDDAGLICTAIHNHGLPQIEEGLSARQLHFSKMIRDADKMDIFRIVDAYYKEMLTGKRNISLELGMKNEDKITDTVLDSFYREEIILKSDMTYLNDFKILQLAWIYDLNFDYTRDYVFKSGHLESIINSISIACIRDDLRKKAMDYLKKH